MTHRRNKVLPFLGQVQFASGQAVYSHETASQDDKHHGSEENQEGTSSGIVPVLHVHDQGNLVEGWDQLGGENFLGFVVRAKRKQYSRAIFEFQHQIFLKRVELRLVFDQAIQVNFGIDDISLDIEFAPSGHVAVEYNVVAVDFRHEGFNFHFEIVGHRCRGQAVHVLGFGVEGQVFLFRCRFKSVGSGSFFFFAAVQFRVLLIDMVNDLFYGISGLGLSLDTAVFNIQFVQDALDFIADFFAAQSFFLRNLLQKDFPETAFGQEGRAERVIRSELEMPHKTCVLAGDGVVHQFGEGVFFAADDLHRSDEPVFGIGTFFFDGQVAGKPLVQGVGHEHGMPCIEGVCTQLQLRIRLVKKNYQGYRDDNKDGGKDYVDFVHSGVEHIW